MVINWNRAFYGVIINIYYIIMRPRNYNNGKIFEVVNLKTKECIYYGYSTADLSDIKKHIKFDIDKPKYRNIKRVGTHNIEILLVENVKVNSLDELKSHYINFILENPLIETEDSQQVNHQPNQSPSLACYQETNQQPSQVPSQPSQPQINQPLEARPQANYQCPHRLHLPPRQHYRPLQLSRDYSSLVSNAFDK